MTDKSEHDPVEVSTQREHLYGLHGVYLDAYNAIVRPDRVFAVRTYTLRRWTPILGATGFWLLIALQQSCYRNPKGSNWCEVGRESLARESGLSETTVHRYLHASEYENSGLHRWVQVEERRKYRSRMGRVTQAPNVYRVVMDAPLAPVDQRGLAQFLQERGAAAGTPAEELESALGCLADLKLSDLLEMFDKYADRFRAPAGWDERAFYPTVADVVLALGIQISDVNGERTRFLDLCSRVQQALVGQVYLGTQYFRQKWAPILGHKLALVVVQLRSRCFWNEDILRDDVSIGTKALATESGCSAGWLRRAFKKPLTQQFFDTDSKRGRQPVFHVTMREPLIPQDEAQYQALLNASEIVPDTGQLGLPELFSETTNEPGERLGNEQTNLVNISETTNAPGERLGNEQTNLVNVSETTNEPGEHLMSTIIVNAYPKKALKQQQHADDPAAVAALLEAFGVGPPNDERILACNPASNDVRAWMLYALTQPGLDTPVAYVVKRLLAGESPPARFRRWARLTPDEWQALWRAAHYSDLYPALPDLVEALDDWMEDFGDIFPAGPFGDGDQVAAEWNAWRERRREEPDSDPSVNTKVGDTTATQIWSSALDELKLQMTTATFDAWLRGARLLRCANSTYVVGVESERAKDWLEHRLLVIIERTMTRLVGHPVEVQFVTLESKAVQC